MKQAPEAAQRWLEQLRDSKVALPAAIVTLGEYLVLAGSVAAAVSSVAVEPDGAPGRADGRTAAEVRDIVEQGDAAPL